MGLPSRNDRPPDIWDTHGILGNVFVNPTASSSAPYPQGFNPWISNVSEHTSSLTVLRCTQGTARRPLFVAKVFAGLDRRRSKGQNMGVCAKVGLLAISLSPQQPLPSSPFFGWSVPLGANHAVEEKDVLDGRSTVPLGLQSHSAVRQCTVPRVSRDTAPPRRGIQRGRQSVSTEIPVTGDRLRAQPLRRCLSQPAKPVRESPVRIRLPLSTKSLQLQAYCFGINLKL